MERPQPPHPVDIHVGQRLREQRAARGMTQGKLATAVDITCQQVQKYERGANRISASRLYQFAHILDVPITFFFDGYGPETSPAPDESGAPPLVWQRLWRGLSALPPELRNAYIAFGNNLVKSQGDKPAPPAG